MNDVQTATAGNTTLTIIIIIDDIITSFSFF